MSTLTNNVPCVDLADFVSGSPQQQQAFVEKLGQAYEDVGFVKVINHGLSDDIIAHLYQYVQQFFELPLAKKRQYQIEGLAGQRGYTSFGIEAAKGSDTPDLKEFYQWGQTIEGEDTLVYPDNVEVAENPVFNDTLRSAYKAFEKSGRALLQAISIYLGLPTHYFDAKVHNGNSILRAIHYPPITQEPKSAIRAEQHEDINLITLLVGASAEGLELLNKQNEWLPINAGPGEIVVNVGDMLQRLTNNKLRSTTHRVVNPPREKWNTHRYSIPFFLHPRPEMDLTCLASCVTAETPKAFSDITAGEYLDERLREIGLKK